MTPMTVNHVRAFHEGQAGHARKDLARGDAEVRDRPDLLAIGVEDRVSHELGEINHACS